MVLPCSIVMSQTLTQFQYLSRPLSDFYRAPSGNDHFFYVSSDQTNVKSRNIATNELFITAYPHPDWQTAPFLSIASIQTVKLLSSWNSECQNCFHKHIIVLLCELWWILSSAVYYCDRECYCFIINMLFQCFWILVQSCTWCLFSSVIV